mmetsp:Transcript_12429/g.40659  ORF Transcript_12429/g.40659 Transcript_12429/m.40659 type:complete len:87 (+) Transcript_12429:1141-1401(+)
MFCSTTSLSLQIDSIMITYSGQSDRLNCATPGGRAFKEGEDKTLAKKASARYYGASLLFRTVASNSVGVPDSKNSNGNRRQIPRSE